MNAAQRHATGEDQSSPVFRPGGVRHGRGRTETGRELQYEVVAKVLGDRACARVLTRDHAPLMSRAIRAASDEGVSKQTGRARPREQGPSA